MLQLISDAAFNLAVRVILVTAIIVPIMVKLLYIPSRKYTGYEKRTIMYPSRDTELRLFASVHRPINAPAITNLLEALCPTKGNTISVYVLHHMELIGRATPLFICHQSQGKNVSYSKNVVFHFNKFQKSKPRSRVGKRLHGNLSPKNHARRHLYNGSEQHHVLHHSPISSEMVRGRVSGNQTTTP